MRLAAFQRRALFDDPETAIGVIAKDLLWAEQNDVDIAIFPECYLQGHSYEAALVEKRALPLGDVWMQKLVRCGSRTTALVGYFERRGILKQRRSISAGPFAWKLRESQPDGRRV